MTHAAKIGRIQHFQGLLTLHLKTVRTVFELLPRYRKFTETSRDLILHRSFMQLVVLRMSNNVFENDHDHGQLSWRGINGKIYNKQTLINMGLSDVLVNKGMTHFI